MDVVMMYMLVIEMGNIARQALIKSGGPNRGAGRITTTGDALTEVHALANRYLHVSEKCEELRDELVVEAHNKRTQVWGGSGL